jgi:predicted flap endonuclease-1-like 5' DNA nuclease
MIMSEQTKLKLMMAKGITREVADVLEAAGILTPKDIKMADDADLEAIGLSEFEIEDVRKVCPTFKVSG